MIEVTILNHLASRLDVPVGMEVSQDPPPRYVVIEKVGGRSREHIDGATIAIQSCSLRSLYEAACLNEDVKKAMDEIIMLPGVSRCRLNSDYNFTNKDTKVYRYQAVFDIVFYND